MSQMNAVLTAFAIDAALWVYDTFNVHIATSTCMKFIGGISPFAGISVFRPGYFVRRAIHKTRLLQKNAL